MIYLLLISVMIPVASGLGRTQSVGVRGQVMCFDQPAANVKIKLFDEDKLSPDELMASGNSDSSGQFDLKGDAAEFTSLEPKINFYHDCDDSIKPCQRKLTIYIPEKYITYGKEPKTYFNMGVLQLAGKFSGETRDCLN